MCLAIPMKIVSIDDSAQALADLEGLQYQVDLSLIKDPQIGDYVIVHAGFAIERLDQEEARTRIELFRQMAEGSGR